MCSNRLHEYSIKDYPVKLKSIFRACCTTVLTRLISRSLPFHKSAPHLHPMSKPPGLVATFSALDCKCTRVHTQFQFTPPGANGKHFASLLAKFRKMS